MQLAASTPDPSTRGGDVRDFSTRSGRGRCSTYGTNSPQQQLWVMQYRGAGGREMHIVEGRWVGLSLHQFWPPGLISIDTEVGKRLNVFKWKLHIFSGLDVGSPRTQCSSSCNPVAPGKRTPKHRPHLSTYPSAKHSPISWCHGFISIK